MTLIIYNKVREQITFFSIDILPLINHDMYDIVIFMPWVKVACQNMLPSGHSFMIIPISILYIIPISIENLLHSKSKILKYKPH